MRTQKKVELVVDLVRSIKGKTDRDIRDRGAISLLIATSMKISNLCLLKYEDFICADNDIIIDSYYVKCKVLLVHEIFMESIQRQLLNLKHLDSRKRYFFNSKKGRVKYDRIVFYNEPEAFRYMLSRRCKEAGLEIIKPSDIRDVSLRLALENAKTLRQVLAIMNNSSIPTINTIAAKYGLNDHEIMNKTLNGLKFNLLD